MKLYIANTTKQHHDFIYRTPDMGKTTHQVIQVGGQVQIWKDDTHAALDFIINQHASYGLVPVNEIDRTKTFIGLCYSFDKPVDIDAIVRATAHNDDVLVERGLDARKNAAAALNDSMNQDTGGKVNALELEVVEDAKKGEDSDTEKFAETIEVVTEGGRRSRK